MLHIADHHQDVIQRCLKAVVDLYEKQQIKPIIGGVYNVNEIALAHELLENRKSIGKIVIKW